MATVTADRAVRNERRAVRIHYIPSSVPLLQLALLPFDDQPDQDIDICRFKEGNESFYSIFIALTQVGMLERVRNFAEEFGGTIRISSFGKFRILKQGEPVRLGSLLRESVVDPPSDYIRKSCIMTIPFDLMVMAFLPSQMQTKTIGSTSHTQHFAELCARQMGQVRGKPLTQVETTYLTACREADRLENEAWRAVVVKRELDWKRSERKKARDLTKKRSKTEARNAAKQYAQVLQATKDAYVKILAAQQARQKADVYDEIARCQDDFDHDDHPQPVTKHTLIFQKDGSTNFPFSPTELPLPGLNETPKGSRRWLYPVSPEVVELPHSIEDMDNLLISKGIGLNDCTITYPSGAGIQRFLQISFTDHTQYIRAKDLDFVWHTHPLELSSSAAPLSEQMTVIKVDLTNINETLHPTLDEILDDSFTRCLDVTQAWICDLVDAETQPTKLNRDSIVILASYKQREPEDATGAGAEDGSTAFYGPKDVPGWVRTSKGIFALSILDRAPNCTKCHGHSTLQHHTTEKCTSRRCKKYGVGTRTKGVCG